MSAIILAVSSLLRASRLAAEPGRRPSPTAGDGDRRSYAHRRTERPGRRPIHSASPSRRARCSTCSPRTLEPPQRLVQRLRGQRTIDKLTSSRCNSPNSQPARLLRPGAPGPRVPGHGRPWSFGGVLSFGGLPTARSPRLKVAGEISDAQGRQQTVGGVCGAWVAPWLA